MKRAARTAAGPGKNAGSPPNVSSPREGVPRPPGAPWTPVAVFATLMVLYAATACRTVGPGDSGELTVVMSSWGVAHAPGYPLLSLIGNLVSALPFPGEPAFVLNLLTSFFAALAAAFLARAVIEFTGNPLAGLAAGLALGTSRVYWEYALVVEVFALNSLFGALLLHLLARFLRGIRERAIVLWPLPAAVLVATTAITHHLTLVLLAIPVFVVFAAALTANRRRLDGGRFRRAALLSVGAGLLGLLPLLYIPLAAHGNPVLSWDDPTTTGNLVRLLKREDFGSGTLMSPWGVASMLLDKGESASPLGGRHLRIFFAEMPRNFGWVFVLLAAAGAVLAALRNRYAALLLAGFLGMLAVFFLRVNSPVLPVYMGVTERFYILPNVVIALFGGMGLAFLCGLAGRLNRRAPAALTALALLATAWTAFHNGSDVSMRRNTFTRDFGANLIEGLPENAVLLSEGDLFHNAFYYQQVCLGKRPDVEFVDEQKLTYPWYVNQVRRRNRFHLPEGMQKYSADSLTWTNRWLDLNLKRDGRAVVAVSVRDQSWTADYRLLPMGLWWRFWPKEAMASIQAPTAEFESVVRRWRLESLSRTYHERSWETAERPFYFRAMALLAGMKDLAEDAATGRADVDPDPGAAEWLAKAYQFSGGDSATVRVTHLEVYDRVLTEQWFDFSVFGNPGPLIRKTIALAERAVARDPGNVVALKTLAPLLRLDPPAYDPLHELDVRARIVDLAPGDETQLAGYMQLAINLLNDPAKKGAIDPGALARRERAYLERLELAMKVSSDASLAAQRDKWREYLRRTEAIR